MKITKEKKEIEIFKTKTKCGIKMGARSEKLLKHNIKMHNQNCKECKNDKYGKK